MEPFRLLASFVFMGTVLMLYVEGLSYSTSEAGMDAKSSLTSEVEAKGTTAAQLDESLVDNHKPHGGAVGNNLELHSPVVAVANVSINLSCPLSLMGSDVVWFKDGEVVRDVEDAYKLHGDGNLEVLKPGENSHGDFQCSVRGDNETVTVTLYVKPYIHPLKNSKNVIEDDPFVMDCKAWGHPDVVLTWYFNGSNISSSEHHVFKKGQYQNNSILRIPHTSFVDAGLYECIATSLAGINSTAVNVTIKDKFAAVWPFLGICAEVAILCTVIFIYEKRRERRLQRQQEVAEIEEKQVLKGNGISAETDAGTNTDKPDSDLRQRNK